MTLANIILIPALILPLIPAVIMGFTGSGWFYFLTIFTFYLCFGIFEFLSTKIRRKTISKDIAETKPALFWMIIGTWTLMNVGIAAHWWLMR